MVFMIGLLIRALEAWPLYASLFCSRTEVIYPNKPANLLDMEILELQKGVVYITNHTSLLECLAKLDKIFSLRLHENN